MVFENFISDNENHSFTFICSYIQKKTPKAYIIK